MKRFLLFLILVTVSNSFAITGFSYFWTPKAKDTVTATKLKANYDTTRLWAQRICDTLNNNKVPFSGAKLHDSVFSYIRIDSIRNSPNIDTLLGVRYIGGAPKIDSVRGPVIIDTFTVSKGIGGTLRLDSLSANLGFETKKRVKASSFTTNGIDTLTYLDTTFYDSLFDGATYRARGLARIIAIGSQITLYQPQLTGTITASTETSIQGIPPKFINSAIGHILVLGVNNSSALVIYFQLSSGSVFLEKINATQLDAGTGGISAMMINWIN